MLRKATQTYFFFTIKWTRWDSNPRAKSQDLANLHNNHSVTRHTLIILLVGFEPTSAYSQYDILPFKLQEYYYAWWGNRTLVNGLKAHCTTIMLTRWKWRDLNPQLLCAKQIFYHVKLHSINNTIGGTWTLKSQILSLMCLHYSTTMLGWDGNRTHTTYFADNCTTIMLLSLVSQGNRTLIWWLTVTCSTIKLAKLLPMEGVEPSH